MLLSYDRRKIVLRHNKVNINSLKKIESVYAGDQLEYSAGPPAWSSTEVTFRQWEFFSITPGTRNAIQFTWSWVFTVPLSK